MSVLMALAFAAPVSANPVILESYPWADAHYGMGLFVGAKTPLRISSEDLYISPDQVRIRYAFANDTAKPRDEVLDFPLPEIDIGKYWVDTSKTGPWRAAVGRHTKDPLNFEDFRVRVNGKTVAVRGWQVARIWSRRENAMVDVTHEITDAGLPVLMLEKSEAIDRLPEATRRRLFDDHLLGTHDGGWKAGTYPKTYYPAWRVSTGFNWRQSFPARSKVTVDVTYQPMTGGSLRPVSGSQLGFALSKPCYQDWVFPDWTPWGIRSRKTVSFRTTGYILTTAQYWNGPIGRFHLTLDKLKPGSILSLCWDGPLKKTGPTTFEFTAENFTPTRDIHMLVIE